MIQKPSASENEKEPLTKLHLVAVTFSLTGAVLISDPEAPEMFETRRGGLVGVGGGKHGFQNPETRMDTKPMDETNQKWVLKDRAKVGYCRSPKNPHANGSDLRHGTTSKRFAEAEVRLVPGSIG